MGVNDDLARRTVDGGQHRQQRIDRSILVNSLDFWLISNDDRFSTSSYASAFPRLWNRESAIALTDGREGRPMFVSGEFLSEREKRRHDGLMIKRDGGVSVFRRPQRRSNID